MLWLRFVVWMFSVGVVVGAAGVVTGQDYPNRPIRIYTTPAGGSQDFLARLIAQGIAGSLGQQVIVENRPSGVISGETVAKALPDGYSLLVSGSLWVAPLMQKMPYDPVRDFSPVTVVSKDSNVLVVHVSLPVKTVKELIALAKSRPGELNYAASSIGGGSHLAAELFKSMAGINIVRVAYKGSGAAAMSVVSGETQLIFGGPSAMAPHVKLGKLRALAVTSAEPSILLPGLPTIAATLPGYESVGVNAIFAPAKTPAAIVGRLNQEIVRVVNQPDVKERLLSSGQEPVGSSPEQLAATMKSEIATLGKLIKEAGIKVE